MTKLLRMDIEGDKNEFIGALKNNPHLQSYVERLTKREGTPPAFYVQLDRELRDREELSLIYPVGDPVFIHISKEKGKPTFYHAIEPEMTPEDEVMYNRLMNKLMQLAPTEKAPETDEELMDTIFRLVDRITTTKRVKRFFASDDKIYITNVQKQKLQYWLTKNFVGLGPIEPFIRDHYIEDIHAVGVGNCFLDHKIFGKVETNVSFDSDDELNRYILRLSERIGSPVSDSHPIVDAMLPDGSRLNIIYTREISLAGSSFTIRKFSEVPISVTQLIKFGTMSPMIAAYLWLLIENGMSGMVLGETASGKTTTLNAISAFIKDTDKVYSVESTPEITIPHKCWQHLVTRDSKMGEPIAEFDLIKAALRSRPNYIIVGEIRGKEGHVAFQAMATGHPVLSTFHAASVRKMIHRLTGDPINVPISFIDNLNFCVFQRALYIKGNLERRVVNVEEIEGYSPEIDGILKRTVFEWNAARDEHNFTGYYNSFLLEEKIAPILGYADKREVYEELELRAKILDEMVTRKIFNFFDVFDVLQRYRKFGVDGLPFSIW